MALAPGSRIGSFTVVTQIGAGGMGEVYRARDARLGREVALKVLPDEFAGDAERLARFEREAQLLASLNHPHIAHIHGLEESGSVRALVMELVDGDTLSDRIARGALPVAEALAIAAQIADALQFAHDHGVVHRDLKPANVKITADGSVKVLDFGLAKAMGTDTGGEAISDASHSPTISIGSTRAGVILGTAAYMSPEQARGKSVDKRTDIWAFGCLLYECLTGRQAFAGETISDTISLILQREPDWRALPAQTPASVRRLLTRCLEKDAKKRLRDIGDARIELEAPAGGDDEHAGRRAGLPRWGLIAAAVVLAGLGVAGGFMLGGGAPVKSTNVDARLTCVAIESPPNLRVSGWKLTPDGRRVIFLAQDGSDVTPRLYARSLDDYAVRPIAGTDGVTEFTCSVDSRWIVFVAPVSPQGSDRRLARVPSDGSSPAVTLANMEEIWRAPCCLANGDILLLISDGNKYVRVPARGGTTGGERTIHNPAKRGGLTWTDALPDGRGMLVQMNGWQDDGFHISCGVLNLETDSLRILFTDGGGAEYASTGHIVFARSDVLFAAPFDLKSQTTTGDAVALRDGVRTSESWSMGEFYLASEGALLFAPGGRTGSQRRLVWLEDGAARELSADRQAFDFARPSPDGKHLAATIANARGLLEVWMGDTAHADFQPLLAFAGADCSMPTWSRDGTRIAVNRVGRTAEDGIYVVNSDGSGAPLRIAAVDPATRSFFPIAWIADGSGLIAMREDLSSGRYSLFSIAADGSSAPKRFDTAPGDFGSVDLSHDGHWIAYVSRAAGRCELYVAPFDPRTGPGRAVRASDHGATFYALVAWRGSRDVLYLDTQNHLMSVTISTNPVLSAATPVTVADLRSLHISPWGFAGLADGRILAVQGGEDEGNVTHYRLVLNWFDELRTRIAAH